MKESTQLPAYRHDHFVSREKELEEVIVRVKDLLAGPRKRGPYQTRTIIIQGEHGMGKSWLLAHIEDWLNREAKTVHLLLDLDNHQGYGSPEETVKAIWHLLYHKLLKRAHGPSASLEQLTSYILQEFKTDLLSKQPLILLIDSVYETDWEFLKVLEVHLLAPLIVEQDVILIMAGRGKPYPWTAPELRLRAHFIILQPFNEPDTGQQLTVQVPETEESASHIYNISKGNPKTTYLTAITGSGQEALGQVLDDTLAYLKEDIRPAIRQSAEALCLPNRFDIKLAEDLFKEYIASKEPRLRRKVVEMIDELVAAGLVFWSTEQRAYTFYDSTHNLLRQYMEHKEREKAIKLHEIALTFYQEWVDSGPPNKARWQVEVDYHKKRLTNLQGAS